MDRTGLPAINTRVDVLLGSGASYPSRVEGVSGDLLQVAAPMDPAGRMPVDTGDPLELAWLRDGGRVAAPARLTAVTHDQPPCWEVRVVGDVRRQSRRGFVRGGGGEPVRLERPGGAHLPAEGWIVDIGEASLRARMKRCDLDRGDPVEIAIELGPDVVRVTGRVLDVRHLKETRDFDVIVAYQPSEAVGRTIRGYVMRLQVEERRRTR